MTKPMKLRTKRTHTVVVVVVVVVDQRRILYTVCMYVVYLVEHAKSVAALVVCKRRISHHMYVFM